MNRSAASSTARWQSPALFAPCWKPALPGVAGRFRGTIREARFMVLSRRRDSMSRQGSRIVPLNLRLRKSLENQAYHLEVHG